VRKSQNRLVVFAKEPAAGGVKTRLAREIGERAAVALYGAFLDDLARALAGPLGWEAVVAHAEPAPGPGLRSRFGGGWAFEPQGEGSLGDRMAGAILRARRAGRAYAVIAGSDAPTLSASDVSAAFRGLRSGAGVVASPAPDGGYSLVGTRTDADPFALFRGVRWSTEYALSDTLAAAEGIGLEALLLPGVPDVDVLADLDRLAGLLREQPERAPATAVLLGGRESACAS
jgi:uncharacterized protein